MKNLKNTLLASSIILALAGCDDKDFKVPVDNNVNANAPTVTDYVRDIPESTYGPVEEGGPDVLSFTGTSLHPLIGDAYDADGDSLSITNTIFTISDSNDDSFDRGDNTGFSIVNGTTLVVNPLELAADLDSGQIRTAVYTFDISDGLNTVSRSMTINVQGRDFKPEAEEDLVVVYTRSANDDERIDLSEGVVDLDGEELTYHSLAIVGDHPYELSAILDDNELSMSDLDSVFDMIDTGDFEEFRFTYKISDHAYTITRELSIGLLGVEKVPGAPVFTEYFLENASTENNNPVDFDLTVDATDDEGDAISIKNFTVDGGGDMPANFTLEGNTLSYVPAMWMDSLAPGDEVEFDFLFEVEDANGNTSDGQRRLNVTITGEDNNLLIANGFNNIGFEDVSSVGIVNGSNTAGFGIGWANEFCDLKEVRASSARTGTYGYRMEGSQCHTTIPAGRFIPELMENERYLVSYWLRSDAVRGNNGNPYVPISVAGGGEMWSGPRFGDITTLDTWQEHAQVLESTAGGKYAPYVGRGLMFNLMKWLDAGKSKHDIDDFNLVRLSAFTHESLDVLSDDSGVFEADEAITTSGGVAEIRDVAGENKLYVDTTGETSVTVSLPVDATALEVDGRYVISFDVENINSEDASAFNIDITNGTESISTSGTAADGSVELIIWEADARTASVDWSAETMTFDITFTQTDSQFYVDNVRLYTLP